MNDRINKKVYALALIMLLLYPFIFSFTHVITHHLKNQLYLHQPEELCCGNVHPNDDTFSETKFEASIKHCPIAEFEFSFAISVNATIEISNDFQRSFLQFIFISSFISSENINQNAPRAPPISFFNF